MTTTNRSFLMALSLAVGFTVVCFPALASAGGASQACIDNIDPALMAQATTAELRRQLIEQECGGGSSGDTPAECGNGKCERGESNSSCPQDCPPPRKAVCGNGKCERGESHDLCPQDCPDDGNGGQGGSGNLGEAAFRAIVKQIALEQDCANLGLSGESCNEAAVKAALLARKGGGPPDWILWVLAGVALLALVLAVWALLRPWRLVAGYNARAGQHARDRGDRGRGDRDELERRTRFDDD